MVSAVNFRDAWLPALVDSGSVLVMTAIGDDRAGAESFCALLRCPACARLLVVTEPQFCGAVAVTCGAEDCPAAFILRDGVPVGLPCLN